MSERRTLALAAAVVGAAVPMFLVTFTLWQHAGLGEQASHDPLAVAAFAASHPALYAVLPLTGVVMHLAALVLVVGLHRALAATSPLWAPVGSALALFWITADLLQNLIHYAVFVGPTPLALVASANRAADDLWHAGHMGGGLWILVLAAIGAPVFGRAHRVVCALAGAAFALHPFVFPLVPAWFGVEMLLVPLWAFWTAVSLARPPTPSRPLALAPS